MGWINKGIQIQDKPEQLIEVSVFAYLIQAFLKLLPA
jgi:hypothetical protein